MLTLLKKINLTKQAFSLWFQRPYFGFIQGHSYLSKEELTEIELLVGKCSNKTVDDFENSYQNLIGDGQAVSFASGRMGFFALMRTIGIWPGEEVGPLMVNLPYPVI